jgi:hypothetical protein
MKVNEAEVLVITRAVEAEVLKQALGRWRQSVSSVKYCFVFLHCFYNISPEYRQFVYSIKSKILLLRST